jgi:endo-1,4-beta-mannosidase
MGSRLNRTTGYPVGENTKGFLIGINYWPRETAMYWWRRFDASTVRRDFPLLAAHQLKLIRIFLLWEDFHPEVSGISGETLNHLVQVADTAYDSGIQILPTFFTGHMSGINWLPPWMVQSFGGEERFPIYSAGELRRGSIRNMYEDRDVWKAQKLLIRETTSALRGHPAVWGWDLGNEPSNLVLPPSKDAARGWLEEMVTELKRWEEDLPVTLGLHQEDLEEDRNLGPGEAARFCDILSMHAYPGYTTWADGPLDDKVPLFLSLLTQWLGEKTVLLEEFGVPTQPSSEILDRDERKKLGRIVLVSEDDGEEYSRRILELLDAHGFLGALFWCFSDYDPALWDIPPLNDRIHERFFGLFRWNATPKGAAKVASHFSPEKTSKRLSWEWIDIDRRDFYERPLEHLEHLYRNFRNRFQEV